MEIKPFPHQSGYTAKCYIYEEMIQFLQQVETQLGVLSDLTFSVGLVDPGYYSPVDGLFGYHGPNNGQDPDTFPAFSKNTETFNISFIANCEWIKKNQKLLDSLYCTPGGRPKARHRTCSIWEIANPVTKTVKYGVYKKPIFDKIYLIMREANPNLTALNLAKYRSEYDEYNLDFVDVRKYDTDLDCLKTWEMEQTECANTGEANIVLSIITTDLEVNTEKLLTLLQNRKTKLD